MAQQETGLLHDVSRLLEQGLSVNQAAKQLGYDNPSTLYQKLYRLGYRIETERRLVPVHADPLDRDQAA